MDQIHNGAYGKIYYILFDILFILMISEFGSQCDPRSKLIKCQNGLKCDPLTGKCSYPESPMEQKECMKQYYNRVNLRNTLFSHTVKQDDGSVKNYSYGNLIKYSNELELPQCNLSTGEFKLKQCRGKKLVNSILMYIKY